MIRTAKPESTMKYHLIAFFALFLIQNLSAQYGVETDPLTGKKGLVDPIDGRKVIPFEFDDIQPWAGDTLVTVTKGKLRGLYGEKSGRLLIPVAYDEIDVSWQAGSKLGYAGVKKAGKLGLYNFKGKQVLPLQYEYVRAVFADLLVARMAGDTVLQFFDAAGKPIFKTPGNTAWPGFDDHTTEIIRADKSRYFRNKKGQSVFPENITHGRWTDGKVVMCATVTPGKIFNHGLLTWSGDTILSCIYDHIIPVPPGRFVVKTVDNRMGVVNDQGVFLIPLATKRLMSEGRVFVQRAEFDRYADIVYDTDGNVLLEKVNFVQYSTNRLYMHPMPVPKSGIYFLANKNGQYTGNSTGFFNAYGKVILPMEYSDIQFFSEKHAILALSKGAYTIWNLQGKQVVPGRFEHIKFCTDPNVLYGVPEGSEKWGFVHLDKPGEARFEYDAINNFLWSNYFSVMVNKQYFLHAPSGKRINNESFVYIGAPAREHYEAWRKAGKKGKLVAQGTRVQEYNGPWVGFDEKGKAHDFKALEDNSMFEAPPMIEEIIEEKD